MKNITDLMNYSNSLTSEQKKELIKKSLLEDYIKVDNFNKEIIENFNIGFYTPLELKENLKEVIERKKSIEIELNKLNSYIYFNSTIGNFDLKSF